MKYWSLIGILVLFCGCDTARRSFGVSRSSNSDGTIRLIVAGQSNGSSGIQGTQGPIASSTGRVIIHDQATNFDGVPTTANPTSGSVSWVYLGDALVATRNETVEVFNIARGNTSSIQWMQNGWYRQIAVLASQHRINAVLWVQGESDVYTDPNVYYTNLKTMIQSIPNLQWFIAIDGYANSNTAMAQTRLIAERIALPGPDLDSLRTFKSAWFERGQYNGVSYKSGAEFTNVEGLRGHAMAWYSILLRYM